MAWEWHRRLEARQPTLAVLAFVVVTIGGLVLLIPPYFLQSTITAIPGVRPYTALEQEGRDIYVREGCYTCHSQQIRPFINEVQRYGAASTAGESIYDHPFQWGSKRTGPDLAREGGKYPNLWHLQHMIDPRSTSPGSVMPTYAFLVDDKINLDHTVLKLGAMQTLGVPYKAHQVSNGNQYLEIQAQAIAADLKAQGEDIAWDSEIVALIAYLQRLGQNPEEPLEQLLPENKAASQKPRIFGAPAATR